MLSMILPNQRWLKNMFHRRRMDMVKWNTYSQLSLSNLLLPAHSPTITLVILDVSFLEPMGHSKFWGLPRLIMSSYRVTLTALEKKSSRLRCQESIVTIQSLVLLESKMSSPLMILIIASRLAALPWREPRPPCVGSFFGFRAFINWALLSFSFSMKTWISFKSSCTRAFSMQTWRTSLHMQCRERRGWHGSWW